MCAAALIGEILDGNAWRNSDIQHLKTYLGKMTLANLPRSTCGYYPGSAALQAQLHEAVQPHRGQLGYVQALNGCGLWELRGCGLQTHWSEAEASVID